MFDLIDQAENPPAGDKSTIVCPLPIKLLGSVTPDRVPNDAFYNAKLTR